MDYELRYITKELTGADIAKEYKDQENYIYVVGGDGTITMTIPGLVDSNNKLGIIPAGSGNDTYKAIKKLSDGDTKIDLGKINNMYFINVACIGIDADVANNVDIFKNKNVPPKQIYNASILYTFKNYKFKKINISTNIKTIDDYYSILSICNGAYYGGGFNIAPKSQLTDGVLDIYYAEKMPKIRMIPLLLKVKKGTHEGKRRIHKYRAKHIEINLEEDVTFNVDGEMLTDKKFVIDIIPMAIWVHNEDDLVEEIIN